ncbi:MAG: hypothetical protein PUD22_06810 [Erysipelotrichaceae bacterium]|nr:hypothetical protein [Erysipelotrichaceae bacterium]
MRHSYNNSKIPPYLRSIYELYGRLLDDIKLFEIIKNNTLYEMSGVKGIDYSRNKGTFNKEMYDKKYYQLSDELSEIDESIQICKSFIVAMDNTLKRIKDQNVAKEIKAIYCKPYDERINDLVKKIGNYL